MEKSVIPLFYPSWIISESMFCNMSPLQQTIRNNYQINKISYQPTHTDIKQGGDKHG